MRCVLLTGAAAVAADMAAYIGVAVVVDGLTEAVVGLKVVASWWYQALGRIGPHAVTAQAVLLVTVASGVLPAPWVSPAHTRAQHGLSFGGLGQVCWLQLMRSCESHVLPCSAEQAG